MSSGLGTCANTPAQAPLWLFCPEYGSLAETHSLASDSIPLFDWVDSTEALEAAGLTVKQHSPST